MLVRPRKGEVYRAGGRPAPVVQGGAVDAEAYGSLVVCLITASSPRGSVCRIEIPASSETGLARPSEIMTEKVAAIPRAQVGDTTGRVDAAVLRHVDRALLLLLDAA